MGRKGNSETRLATAGMLADLEIGQTPNGPGPTNPIGALESRAEKYPKGRGFATLGKGRI